jgi:hypothetical protein
MNHPWLSLEPTMLLSIINLKLRDHYGHIDSLCEEERIDRFQLEEVLKSIGYVYIGRVNQFKVNE